jgi:transposase InsO family protein
VEAFLKSGRSLRDFAKVWGLSSKTLSGWRLRYEREGPKALESRRARPRRRKARDPRVQAERAEIARVKRRFPIFGIRRVRDFLLRFRGLRVSIGRVRETFREEQLKTPPPRKKKRRRKAKVRRFERARPRELWQSDITSFVLPRHRQRVYLVAYLDDYSRYVVSFGLHLHQKQDIVIEALLEGIARFGKPKEVLTDQGRQYYSWRGKSGFVRLLEREGIRHVVSRAHHPQTLGKAERFWATVAHEFWERTQPQDLAEARERLGHFVAHYNHFRPHQGIDGLVPADRFFGAEDALRQTLEAQLTRNELALALEETPRTPVFLFGQVGEQQVSLHGEKGRLVIQTPEGGREEMRYDELGGSRGKEQGSDDDTGDDRGAAEADAALPQAALPAPAEAGAAGEGAVGGGQRGGEGARAPDVRGDAGVLAGQDEQGGGGEAAGGAAAAGLAALAAGAVGYGGGASEAAAAQEGGLDADRPERRPEGAEETDRAARAGAEAGGGRDRAAARPAGAAGEEGPARDEGAEDGAEEEAEGDQARAGEKKADDATPGSASGRVDGSGSGDGSGEVSAADWPDIWE